MQIVRGALGGRVAALVIEPGGGAVTMAEPLLCLADAFPGSKRQSYGRGFR